MTEPKIVPATEETKVVRRIGFWSALLMALTYLWFYAAFLPYSLPSNSAWNTPWPGMAAYAASFQPQPFLAWVVPSFLLPPIILVMMVSVHRWTAEERQMWSLLAVIFAAAYAAVLTPLYYILMTVVPYHLANGTTEGLSLWLFAYHYPYNLFGALEGVGYFLLGISCLFVSQAFGSGRLQHWVRWTFAGLGVSVLALFINPLSPLPSFLGPALGLAGVVCGVLAPILLAVLFRRSDFGTIAREQEV